MQSLIQEELFGAEQYTRMCSMCRGNYPRTSEFFAKGHCKDGMASYCRQCARLRKNLTKAKPDSNSSSLDHRPHKTCAECGKSMLLKHFYMSSLTLDGKTPTCKACTDANSRARQIRQQRLGDLAWSVYFIKDTKNERVIIGSSRDPYLTLTALQEVAEAPLHLLAIHEIGDKELSEKTEVMLHRLFQTYHAGNGWFEMVSSLEKYIALIQKNEYQKAELLLLPKSEKQDEQKSESEKENSKESIVVEGQHFPNISTASAATGINPKMLEPQKEKFSESTHVVKIYKS